MPTARRPASAWVSGVDKGAGLSRYIFLGLPKKYWNTYSQGWKTTVQEEKIKWKRVL